MQNKYNLQKHRHFFASWCASTAARAARTVVNGTTFSLPVATGVKIIEGSGLVNWSLGWSSLLSKENFDEEHRKMRLNIIEVSEKCGCEFKSGRGSTICG